MADSVRTVQSLLVKKVARTVDYALSTAYNFKLISTLHVLDFDPLFSDAHCPISITLNTRQSKVENTNFRLTNEPEVRLWNDEKRDSFVQNLNHVEIHTIDSLLSSLVSKNDIKSDEINTIIGLIENLFAAATFGVKPKVSGTDKPQKAV